MNKKCKLLETDRDKINAFFTLLRNWLIVSALYGFLALVVNNIYVNDVDIGTSVIYFIALIILCFYSLYLAISSTDNYFNYYYSKSIIMRFFIAFIVPMSFLVIIGVNIVTLIKSQL